MPAKILIVEDDESVGSIDELILKANGYFVDWILDAKNIIPEVLAYKPDLIIMDVMLPGKSGFEASRELEQNSDTSEIPILFVSVINIPDRFPNMLRGDHVRFLQKPYEIDDFLGIIRQMISKSN